MVVCAACCCSCTGGRQRLLPKAQSAWLFRCNCAVLMVLHMFAKPTTILHMPVAGVSGRRPVNVLEVVCES
jgi:hypothetical protein